MNFKSVLKYLIPFGLAGIILYFLFTDNDIDIVDMMATLKEANYRWVLLSMVLSLVSHWARAYRWQLLFKPLGYRLAVLRLMVLLMCMYVVNLVLPRAGEVYRCGLLKRTDGVPISTSFGTVLVERIFDAISLLLILLLDLIIEYDRLNAFFRSSITTAWSDKGNLAQLIIYAMLAGLFLLLVLYLLYRAYKHKFLQHRLYLKVLSVLGDFKKGLTSFKHVDNKLGFFLSTLVIWLTYYLMSYVMIYSIPETHDLTPLAGLSILAMAGLAMVAPVQGGFGTYHYLVGGVLVVYGISKPDGLAFATLLHTSQLVTIIAVGAVCLVLAQTFAKRKIAKDNDRIKDLQHK